MKIIELYGQTQRVVATEVGTGSMCRREKKLSGEVKCATKHSGLRRKANWGPGGPCNKSVGHTTKGMGGGVNTIITAGAKLPASKGGGNWWEKKVVRLSAGPTLLKCKATCKVLKTELVNSSEGCGF